MCAGRSTRWMIFESKRHSVLLACRYIALVASLLLHACAGVEPRPAHIEEQPPARSLRPPPEYLAVTVQYAVDGDTLAVSVAGRPDRIRLWGMNAWEMKEPGGREAKRVLDRLLAARGSRLNCRPVERDRYDRLVAQCFTQDGLDLAAIVVSSGYGQDCPRTSGGHYRTLERRDALLPDHPYCRLRSGS